MSQRFEQVCGWCGLGLLQSDRFCSNCGNPAPSQSSAVVTGNEGTKATDRDSGDFSHSIHEANPKRGHSIVAALFFGVGLTALIVVLIALKQDGSIGAGTSGDETSEASGSGGRCDGAGT
jgi:hypothetical protein